MGEVTSGDYHDGPEVGVCPHGWCGFVEWVGKDIVKYMEDIYESLGKEFGLYRVRQNRGKFKATK